MDWSDLQVFLAVAREGTLGAAGRRIGQSQPTVGRRLRALERSVGQTLFQRTTTGFVLTDEGAMVLAHAERIEEETLSIGRNLGGGDQGLDGTLRIACSDWFGLHMLSPVVAEFAQSHPRVMVEMLTDARVYSLARREADIAFRIASFDEPDVIVRRLTHIRYGVYLQTGRPQPRPGDGEGHDLITMDSGFGGMPDAVWLSRVLPGARVGIRSNSRDVQARLCALGRGVAVLPRPLGDATPGISRIDLGEEPPGRDTFVGYHRDLKRLARLRALLDLVVARFARDTM
ncbi:MULTISPECIES: LysR family transcriptional regulator [unclassified Bradyrhizobium]|uniref:LysR family transcriptional regulator n=1 Tax=unclassified Bradyrhizobium TaxID=2631580 RepID=UPI0028F14AC1|nr:MULTISPECIES: LysR family transcriptional regulator [unclassified Bradyrhizobium]